MKKNSSIKKTVVKTLAVGLSASIAAGQPLAAFAAPNQNGNTTAYEDVADGVADEAQAAADAADAAVNNAGNTTGNLSNAIDNKVESGDAGNGEVTITVESIDSNGNTVNSDETVNSGDFAQDVITKNETVKADDSIDKAEENVKDAKADVTAAEHFEVAKDNTVDEAAGYVQAVEKIVDNAVSDVEKASQEAEAISQSVNSTASYDEAKAALDKLNALANETADKVKAASDAFDELKNRYDAAIAKLNGLSTAFNGSVDSAAGNAQSAQDNLATAKANVLELEKALLAAKAGAEKANAGALVIIKAQENVKGNTNIDWEAEDTLFNEIMKNYYIPQVVNKEAQDVTVTRIEGVDNNDYNYFVVTYTLNGASKKEYYNYKMDGDSASNILIFEKREIEAQASDYFNEYANKNNITDKAAKKELAKEKIFYYEENGAVKFILGKELNSENSAVVNGVTYIKKGNGALSTLISVSAAKTKSELKVGDKTSKTEIENERSYYVVENGQLKKKTVGDVTFTEYQRVQDGAQQFRKEGYTEEEKNALKAQLGDKASFIEVVDMESNETYYQLTGKYVPKFKIIIDWGTIKEFEKPDGAFQNESREARAVFIQRLMYKGFDITEVNLSTGRLKDGVNIGKEEFWVWGEVSYKKDEQTVSNDKEYTNLEEALNALKRDLAREDINIQTVDHIGTWEGVLWKPYKVIEKDVTLTGNEQGREIKDENIEGLKGYKKYSFYLDFLKELNQKKEEGILVAEELYDKAAQLLGEVIQNKNFADNNIKLDENEDENFINFISNAKAAVDKYNELTEKAKVAKGEVVTAQQEVKKLQDTIKGMESNQNKVVLNRAMIEYLGLGEGLSPNELDALVDKLKDQPIDKVIDILNGKLDEAKDKLDKAREKLSDISHKKDEAGNKVNDLAPNPVAPGTTPSGATTNANPANVPADSLTPIATTPGVDSVEGAGNPGGVFAGGVTPAVVPAGFGGAGNVNLVAAADVAAPLGNIDLDDESQGLLDDGDKNIVKGKDVKAPLAENLVEMEENRSWWWLLLLAIATFLGYKTYKHYKNEKEANGKATNKK